MALHAQLTATLSTGTSALHVAPMHWCVCVCRVDVYAVH